MTRFEYLKAHLALHSITTTDDVNALSARYKKFRSNKKVIGASIAAMRKYDIRSIDRDLTFFTMQHLDLCDYLNA